MTRRQFLKHTSVGVPAAGWVAGSFSFPAAIPGVQSKAGFAERDITPEIGMEKPGNYIKIFHHRFHDPCKVRAAVFDDGRKRVALVGIDALVIPRHVVLAARKQIQQQSGIPPEAVLIGASHSHSSGPVAMIQPGEYDFASPLVKKLAYQESSCADAWYLERVLSEIVAAVCHANSVREEVRCGFGSGKEDKAAFNRRYRMKNGLTYTYPGQGNPDILGYAGPIDPEVGVVGAWNKSGQLLGCVVNYACHADASPDEISANWIYYLEMTIRGALGQDAIVVFLQGACGDVENINQLTPYKQPDDEAAPRLVGARVGAEAVKVLVTACPSEFSPLDAASKVVEIKRRVPDPGRVRKCIAIVEGERKERTDTEWIFAKEIVLLDALLTQHPVADVEVQAIQIGPTVLLSNPAELFCQFGLDIKSKSPFKLTYPVELANGFVGYVPTEEAFGPHGGGYETRLTSYSNLESTAGRQMVTMALELAGNMRPGATPEPPQAAPFEPNQTDNGSSPWPYGDVPPELK
jgi:neutral ceramidase